MFDVVIEHGLFGEGSHISTNKKQENSAFSFLIGCKLGPLPENIVLYNCFSVYFVDKTCLFCVLIKTRFKMNHSRCHKIN